MEPLAFYMSALQQSDILEKPGGMGLPAKIEIILSSPSVPCLLPVL